MIHISQSTQHLTWHIVGPQSVSGKLTGILVMHLGFHCAKHSPRTLSFNLRHPLFSQGGRCAVVAQVVLMKDWGCSAIFPGPDLVICILVCPLEKSLLKSFAHFRVLFFVLLLLLLNCGDSLHILDLHSLPDMGNAQFPSVGCLVTLWMCLWIAAWL